MQPCGNASENTHVRVHVYMCVRVSHGVSVYKENSHTHANTTITLRTKLPRVQARERQRERDRMRERKKMRERKRKGQKKRQRAHDILECRKLKTRSLSVIINSDITHIVSEC